MIKEVGCWNCALDGVKSGEPVCPDCDTEKARHCGLYIHEKIQVEKSETERGKKYENYMHGKRKRMGQKIDAVL